MNPKSNLIIALVAMLFTVFIAWQYNEGAKHQSTLIVKLQECENKLKDTQRIIDDSNKSWKEFIDKTRKEFQDQLAEREKVLKKAEERLAQTKKDLASSKGTLEKLTKFHATVTAYTEKGKTAIGSRPKNFRTCAVSRDHSELLGKYLKVSGIGVVYCNDLTHPRFRNRIDLSYPSDKAARKFGLKKAEVVVLAKRIE